MLPYRTQQALRWRVHTLVSPSIPSCLRGAAGRPEALSARA